MQKEPVPPFGWSFVDNKEQAAYLADLGSTNPTSELVFALVAPFPTITDDVTAQAFLNFWKTGGDESVHARKLLVTPAIYEALKDQWGYPAANLVETMAVTKILDTAWSMTGYWAVIPFEKIEPKWKVIAIDGQSPIHNDFDSSNTS